ncbi:MAG TPA: hypothetical protein VFW71_00620 [Actinomycetota bacterium]|nr:hypothetical protein [Actinomycetota bacterium]
MDTASSFSSLHAPAFSPPQLALLRVRVATGMLWVLIALAALGGIRGLAAHPAPGTPPPAAPDGLAGFAELYVAAYLEAGAGQEPVVAAYYHGPLDLSGVTAGARYVARAATVATRELAPGYWAVTVGADVLVAAPGGYQPGGTQYYRVAIQTAPAGLVATTLPAAVPAPVPAPEPALAVPALLTGTVPDPVLSARITTYLQGTLAVTATVGALALAPPTGTHRLAEARVTATDAQGIPVLLDYTVELRRTAGAWAVAAVLPAPPLAATQPDRGPGTGPDKQGGTQ